jgi:hypothetical protein
MSPHSRPTPDIDTDPAVAKDLDLLADPPSTVSAEDLHAALSGPPPSARSVSLTRVLVVGLVLALGFAGGVFADQTWGQSGTAAGPTAARPSGMPTGLLTGLPTGMPTAGAAAGTGTSPAGATDSGSTTTTGTVMLVDGSVLYLSDSTGTQTRVEVADTTTITTTSSTSLKKIDKGDTVTVTGTTNDDGLAATSVEVTK